MKVYKKIIIMLFILLGIVLLKDNSYATETTQKLYQDITINTDGSITVKEAALLSGEYNGRLRNIEFKNHNSNRFTGIYSNFTGNTDIYDGSAITNIKIADISQNNFKTISDINKIEKVYTQKNNASTGDYGVYKLVTSSYGADFKIFCNWVEDKVFYMEYTIKDAVVIHNDIAELYWNVMGNSYKEYIEDFQVLIHLPKEDSDVRIWTHGPLTGINKIVDNKTLSFKDNYVSPYTAETVRIMFNKNLVPNGTKKSNVDGKKYILKYEASQADLANAEREKAKLEQMNEASTAVIELKESPNIYSYNNALQYVNELTDPKEKQDLLKEVYKFKSVADISWRNYVESTKSYINTEDSCYDLRAKIEKTKEIINLGFNEKQKEVYEQELIPYYEILYKKESVVRNRNITIVTMLYLIGFAIVAKLIKEALKQRNSYGQKYFRDFPSDEEPGMIEFLIKGRVTNLSISATILNLIYKKYIEVKEDKNKKDIILIKKKEFRKEDLTKMERNTLILLFENVANGKNKCNLKQFKKYINKTENAKLLKDRIDYSIEDIKAKAESKKYFNKSKLKVIGIIYVTIVYVISAYILADAFLRNFYFGLFIISVIFGIYITILIKYKDRTEKGAMEYSKWMAHKRFLKDFGSFSEKELPEIALWERYLVTATILGCAKKVRKEMQLKIASMPNYDGSVYLNDFYVLNRVSNNITRTVNRSINSAITKVNISETASSSSGGFGGGSSFGGGGGGRRWRRRTLLKSKQIHYCYE